MFKKTQNKREFATTLIFIGACLTLLQIFPAQDNFQEIVSGLVFMLVLPILYIKIILRRNLSDFGMQLGNAKKGFLWIIISLIFAGLFLFIILKQDSLGSDFKALLRVKDHFLFFAIREFANGISIFLVDFLFRGFIMFYLKDFFSKKLTVIFAQSFIFLVFALLSGSSGWIFVVYLYLSIFSGIIAYKSSSILYSSIFHWISIIIIELAILKTFFI